MEMVKLLDELETLPEDEKKHIFHYMDLVIRDYKTKKTVKLAKALDVSVDYLLREGLNASYDKEMVKRLDELETLPEDEKKHIFHYMDLVIRDYKTKKTYNPK
jgi:N-acetylneuraminic acid mutarotase